MKADLNSSTEPGKTTPPATKAEVLSKICRNEESVLKLLNKTAGIHTEVDALVQRAKNGIKAKFQKAAEDVVVM